MNAHVLKKIVTITSLAFIACVIIIAAFAFGYITADKRDLKAARLDSIDNGISLLTSYNTQPQDAKNLIEHELIINYMVLVCESKPSRHEYESLKSYAAVISKSAQSLEVITKPFSIANNRSIRENFCTPQLISMANTWLGAPALGASARRKQ